MVHIGSLERVIGPASATRVVKEIVEKSSGRDDVLDTLDKLRTQVAQRLSASPDPDLKAAQEVILQLTHDYSLQELSDQKRASPAQK